ncbi:hypothetical protein ACH5RR_041645 [Cinchona calisaya]|uniref:Uncharacterized protein n=1 Tax=Cinchona calisaya TaxID=153742 RepID=A0ABD2XUS8_9GENT
MDAVELALSEAAVAVSKLMGSEGFGGGGGDVGAMVGKSQAGQSEARIPSAHASEPAFRHKIPDTGRFVPNGQPSGFHGSDAPEDLKLGNMNISQSLIVGAEAKQLHRRSGKAARNNSSGSKRSRIVQLEVSVNEIGVEDIKGNSLGTGSCPAIAEKDQMPKQRSNSNGKRSDKRNGRVTKSRCDSFCLKNGLGSFSSVAGGGNFLAVYGSKSDVFDVTKPVDELPLNELLDGSFKCPSLVKEKGKGVENSNENLLHSVRKACSLLQVRSPVHNQNSADIDNTYNKKVSLDLFTSGASPTSRIDGGKANSSTVNQPSSDKDSCGSMKPPAFSIDSPLCSPKDILERLALHPSKDLDSLLLDAVKPASSTRNSTDLRLVKTVSHRTGLPPFPWSHNTPGHSKSGPDSVKLSVNKTACPGKWIKVGNALTPSKGSNGLLVDLKSLRYDHRLVPSVNLESESLEVANASSTIVNITSSERVVISSSACSASQVPPAAEYSPRLLAAAQTLCDIASHSLKQNSYDMMKWQKKPSQKTMKACKLELSQKSGEFFVAPEASIIPDNLVKVADGVFPSKKLRLSVNEKTDAVRHTNPDKKAPVNWPAPRSIRSSPSKMFRDSVPEIKNYKHTVKQSYMMPPPPRVIDKSCNGRQKLKKIAKMEWNPTASNLN